MKANIDRFLGKKFAEKNVIVPNGVDPAVFFPDYSKHPDKLRILFIGRLVIQKDPMTFLNMSKTHLFQVPRYPSYKLSTGPLFARQPYLQILIGSDDHLFCGRK